MVVDDKTICFAKIREGAVIPSKLDEDAGYDMYPCFEEEFFVIKPHQTRLVPTGIACAFSQKYYAQVEERSSLAKIGIKKSGGVFDSGYRGEYMICTYNSTDKPFIISKVDESELAEEFTIDGNNYKLDEVTIYPYKKAICQIVMQIIPKLTSKELSYDELKAISSIRSTGGFGHTGK